MLLMKPAQELDALDRQVLRLVDEDHDVVAVTELALEGARLRGLGARQVVWVTMREPTTRTIPPSARGELGQ